jgi:hypothetical protein
MARDRRGRFTAERTTKTTHEVTERITVEDDDTLAALPPAGWEVAHGWDPGELPDQAAYRLQRQEQARQCEWFLAMAVASGADAGPSRAETLRAAKVILRAGPNATPLELTMGRSI